MNEKTILFLLPAVILLLLAVTIILTRKRGLPKGTLIYDDLAHDGTPVRPFFSKHYGLTGKPDMIIRDGNRIIPVELKHTPGRDRPFPSHMLQLAAYCLLIEENFGIRPEYGIIRYRDRQFEVLYTEELERKLLSQMEKIRQEIPEDHLPPICSRSGKCARCGYSEICKQVPE